MCREVSRPGFLQLRLGLCTLSKLGPHPWALLPHLLSSPLTSLLPMSLPGLGHYWALLRQPRAQPQQSVYPGVLSPVLCCQVSGSGSRLRGRFGPKVGAVEAACRDARPRLHWPGVAGRGGGWQALPRGCAPTCAQAVCWAPGSADSPQTAPWQVWPLRASWEWEGGPGLPFGFLGAQGALPGFCED